MQYKRPPYKMVIGWSEENQVYLVAIPALSDLVGAYIAHGDTPSEAAMEGTTALWGLLEMLCERGTTLPAQET